MNAEQGHNRLIAEHLVTHFQRLNGLLTARIERGGLEVAPDPSDLSHPAHQQALTHLSEIEADAEQAGLTLPLQLLRKRYKLEPFAMELLLLCTAAQADEGTARLLGRLRGGSQHGYVDGQLAYALFALSPTQRALAHRFLQSDGILRRAGLLEILKTEGVAPHPMAQALHVPGHMLGFLLGERRLSERLTAVGARLVPELVPEQLPGLEGAIERLQKTIGGFYKISRQRDPVSNPAGLAHAHGLLTALSGSPGSGRSAVVRAVASSIHRALLELDGGVLAAEEDWNQRLRLAAQEAELYGEILHVRHTDLLCQIRPAAPAILARLLQHHAVALVCSHTSNQLAQALEAMLSLRIQCPERLVVGELARAWQMHFPGTVELPFDIDLKEVAAAVPLSGGQLRNAMQLATAWSSFRREPEAPAVVSREELLEAAESQRRSEVGSLTRTEDLGRWQLEDLVLPETQQMAIGSILQACRNRLHVLGNWGFSDLLGRGGGIICLFDGPPGTGKTLTTEVMARELQLELHRINVSTIVDKYIGETDKNLTRLFERIVPERSLLLFDEADSLFAKRTQVRTSSDRYSNMAVATLLQLVERYQGVIVLTTNLEKAIDAAFERRITFKVHFEKPDEEARLALWEAHIPSSAPLADDVDLEQLAEDFEFAGGNIKNVVFRAALASVENGSISWDALYEQACKEAASIGLLIQQGDTRTVTLRQTDED